MENSRLHLIQAAVIADRLRDGIWRTGRSRAVRRLRAMIRIGGQDRAAVAERAQVLGGIKTHRRELARGPAGDAVKRAPIDCAQSSTMCTSNSSRSVRSAAT